MTKDKVLVDTNILMYAVQSDSEFYERSRAFLVDPSYELVTTFKNLSEFLSAMTKGEKPLASVELAWNMVTKFREQIVILYPGLASFTKFENLVLAQRIKGLRIHDVEIAAIGLTHGIFTIATFNTEDFQGLAELTLLRP
jgi:predicted nucleic acid-binding protein